MPKNICQYHPITSISKRELDNRFSTIYRYLCYLQSIVVELTTSTTTTTSTSTTTTTSTTSTTSTTTTSTTT